MFAGMIAFLIRTASASEPSPIHLYLGYVSRITCTGVLKSSAVGDSALVQVEPLPRDTSCGLLLKPLHSGRSNLFIMTSSGSANRIIEIESIKPTTSKALDLQVSTDQEGSK